MICPFTLLNAILDAMHRRLRVTYMHTVGEVAVRCDCVEKRAPAYSALWPRIKATEELNLHPVSSPAPLPHLPETLGNPSSQPIHNPYFQPAYYHSEV
jgi:hypothetical protein